MNKTICLLIVLLSLCFIVGCGSTGSSSNPVAAVVLPTINSITPDTGGPGTLVYIQGKGFGSVQGANFISYAGITVMPNSWTDNQITVTIPQNAATNGSFQITVGGVTSNTSNAFYSNNPVISYISPQTANSGTHIVITGQYFGTTQGSSYVAFNAQNAQVVSWSNNSITCIAPTLSDANSGSVAVIVSLGGSKISNTVSFTISNPLITNVSPIRDNIGSVLTINGQGFGQNSYSVNGSVTIGGTLALIKSWRDNIIEITVPSFSAPGSKNVQVSTNGRQLSTTFIVEAPVAIGFSPNPISENDILTISGEYFGSSSDQVSRIVFIEDYGRVAGVSYYDNRLSFTWPIANVWGSQTKTVTINIGGLSTTILVTAD